MEYEAGEATAVATGQETGAGQEAAAAVLTAAGAGAGQGASQDDGFVRVARAELDAFKANDGRFRQLQSRGDLELLQHLQGSGVSASDARATMAWLAELCPSDMTLPQYLEYLRTPAQDERTDANGAGGREQEAASDDDRPMTVADYRRQRQREREEAAAEKTRLEEARTAEEKKAANDDARKAVYGYWSDVAKELKADSGARANSFRGIYEDAMDRVLLEDLLRADPLLSPEGAAAEAAAGIPDSAQLDRAKALALADWKDLGNEIVSAAADGQDGWPNATVGAGAGGPPPPPGKAGVVTAGQRANAIMGAIDKVANAAGYQPPA